MTESDFVKELARRAGVTDVHACALVTALGEMARELKEKGEALPISDLRADATTEQKYVPSPRDIHDLIASAQQHPLGLEFLLHGQLCAVATMFRAHAFTVEAARQYIAEHGAAL